MLEGQISEYAEKWPTVSMLGDSGLAGSLMKLTQGASKGDKKDSAGPNNAPTLNKQSSKSVFDDGPMPPQSLAALGPLVGQSGAGARRNTKLTLTFNAGAKVDDIIDRMFIKTQKTVSGNKRSLQRAHSTDQGGLELEQFLNTGETYSMEPRRKLYSKNTQRDDHYIKKLNNFLTSKLASYGKGSFVGEQELYYNIEAQKTYVCEKPSKIIFIPKSFYYQVFIKLKKYYFAQMNRNLFVNNGLFGNLGMNLDVVTILIGSFAKTTIKRGDVLHRATNSSTDSSFFFILIEGTLRVDLLPKDMTPDVGNKFGVDSQRSKDEHESIEKYRKKVPQRNSQTCILIEPFSVIFVDELLKKEEDCAGISIGNLIYTAESVEVTLLKLPSWVFTESVRNNRDLKDRIIYLLNQLKMSLDSKTPIQSIKVTRETTSSKSKYRPCGLLKAKCVGQEDPVPHIDLIVENIALLRSIERPKTSKEKLERAKTYSKCSTRKDKTESSSKDSLIQTKLEQSVTISKKFDSIVQSFFNPFRTLSNSIEYSKPTNPSQSKEESIDIRSDFNRPDPHPKFPYKRPKLKTSARSSAADVQPKAAATGQPLHKEGRSRVCKRPFSSFEFSRRTLHDRSGLPSGDLAIRPSLQKHANPRRLRAEAQHNGRSRSPRYLNIAPLALSSTCLQNKEQESRIDRNNHMFRSCDDLLNRNSFDSQLIVIDPKKEPINSKGQEVKQLINRLLRTQRRFLDETDTKITYKNILSKS